MRFSTDDLIHEIKLRLNETKSIRNKVLLKNALKSLTELKALNEKKF